MAEKNKQIDKKGAPKKTQGKAEGKKKKLIEPLEGSVAQAAGKPSGKTKTPDKATKIIEEIEKLTVIELLDLVKTLQEKFGVTAMPAAASTPAAVPPPGAEGPAPEQTTFNVVLAEAGPNKISVIKAVRELVSTLGLKEAKDLVEAAPKDVLTGVNKEKAEEAKKKLEAVEAKVELK